MKVLPILPIFFSVAQTSVAQTVAQTVAQKQASSPNHFLYSTQIPPLAPPGTPENPSAMSTTYFSEHTISVHEGSKINDQNKYEFIDQVKSVVAILNKNEQAISTFDQHRWPGHSFYSGATGFSISTDAFEYAIQAYAPELKESVLYQQFKAMQAAHQPNQPECGLSRVAIDSEEFNSEGYIHTHNDFDGGVYTACAVSLGGDSSVGTQFAQGPLVKKDTGDSGGDIVYSAIQETVIQGTPNNEIYFIPSGTPHGCPTSGPRIFMRISSDPVFNPKELERCRTEDFTEPEGRTEV